jgi:hypothetical protein
LSENRLLGVGEFFVAAVMLLDVAVPIVPKLDVLIGADGDLASLHERFQLLPEPIQ